MLSFKGAHFPQDIILTGVRWYGRLPAEYAARRSTHARAWGPRGSLHGSSVGYQVQPTARGSVSPPQNGRCWSLPPSFFSLAKFDGFHPMRPRVQVRRRLFAGRYR